jgi:exonuclease III
MLTLATVRPEAKSTYAKLVSQGWTDALRLRHPHERIYTFWDYFFGMHMRVIPACASIICW